VVGHYRTAGDTVLGINRTDSPRTNKMVTASPITRTVTETVEAALADIGSQTETETAGIESRIIS
jgi:hypothetical protein